MVLHCTPHQFAEFQPLPLQRDLVARNPRHVEQIVDQAGELRDLPADHRLGAMRLLAAGNRMVKDIEAVGNRRERIAQLV